jgi:hypothetical protein
MRAKQASPRRALALLGLSCILTARSVQTYSPPCIRTCSFKIAYYRYDLSATPMELLI